MQETMNSSLLYVSLDRQIRIPELASRLPKLGIRQWLYLGEDTTWRIQAEAAIPKEIVRVSVADLLDKMSWHLRQPYIDWIGQLSKLNNSPTWWASELAAKNPYSMLYVRVCLLAIAKQLIASGILAPTLVITSSPALLDGVVQMAGNSGVVTKPLVITLGPRHITFFTTILRRYLRGTYRQARSFSRVILRRTGNILEDEHFERRRILAARGVTSRGDFAGEDTVLFFTWVDRRSFSPNGEYSDPYFGPLPQMLKNLGYRVAFVPGVLPTIPFDEAVDRLLKTGEIMFFPELFVDAQECRACGQHVRNYHPIIPPESKVGNILVYRLALEHWDETRRSLGKILTYQPLVANLAAGNVLPRQIIYLCEGHSWEHVLNWSVRKHMPRTGVVGYDNLTLSRLVLGMFPARTELSLRPLPDRIVANGPLYRDIMVGSGLPPQMVQAGWGIRHNYLWDEDFPAPGEGMARRPSSPIRILVATAIGFGESVELVAKAAQAFGGDQRYEILVKCHPLVKTEQVATHLGELARHSNLQFVTSSIKELLPTVDILLYTYTIVCYEALQHGVFPICVRAENFLNLDKLEGSPDVRWVATTPEDLRRIATQLLNMSSEERSRWQNRALEVVRAALAPATPESVNAFLL